MLDIHRPEGARLIDGEARFEKLASGFRFVEGPVWSPVDSALVFSDIIGGRMHRWSAARGLELFRAPSRMAKGNAYDRKGRLITCEHAASRLTRTEADGSLAVLASHFEGRELNSPNDVVVKSDGAVYFTDPPSGRGPVYGVERPQELDFQGIFRLDPQNGAIVLLASDFTFPNGLCFSADERRLFVNDSRAQVIGEFPVRADGTLGPGRLFARLSLFGEGVADGMKLDRQGQLYCCGPASRAFPRCRRNPPGGGAASATRTASLQKEGSLKLLSALTALIAWDRSRTRRLGGRYDGKTYGMPLRGQPQLLLYRRGVFEKLGLKPPRPGRSSRRRPKPSRRKAVWTGSRCTAARAAPARASSSGTPT